MLAVELWDEPSKAEAAPPTPNHHRTASAPPLTYHSKDGGRLAGGRHQVLKENLVLWRVHPPQLGQGHVHHLKLVAFGEQV